MKVLYVSQYFPPEVGAGAVRAEVMVRHLTRMGFKVDVLSEAPNYPTGKLQPGYRNRWAHREQRDGYSVTRLWVMVNQRRNVPEQLAFFFSFMVSSFLHMVAGGRRYDVVFATSPPLFASISACLYSKMTGAKFVLEIRDLWPDSAIQTDSFSSDSWFIRLGHLLERWLYRSADLIVAVTPESERIIRGKAGHDHTVVVHNGVDTRLFRKIGEEELLPETRKAPGTFRVGYVGSLGLIHDMRTLIQAARLCEDDPDIEFVIVGDGGQKDQMLGLLEEFGPRNVKWLGMKGHELIPHYISSFDVAVNPINDSEAFRSIITVKFYEYLACEVPVISLAEGAQRRISEESGAGLACPIGDPRVLADTIRNLKADPERLAELARNARPFIENGYTRGIQAGLLAQALRGVTEERKD